MLSRAAHQVLMGLYFYPRGGSAQVTRSLCRQLSGSPWEPALFSGSMGGTESTGNAGRFFDGIDCHPVDYSSAHEMWILGGDPMGGVVPMHASFEDKRNVPDRSFFELDNAAYHRQVASWSRRFASSGVEPTVAHLHHLTPMHQAAMTVWPDLPIVTHLHGTELKMLAAAADAAGWDAGCGSWTSEWVRRMRHWAGRSERIVVVSEQDQALALDLLPVASADVVVIGNGVDTGRFSPQAAPSRATRRALWQRLLVDDAQGWKPGSAAGSVRYTAADLDAFVDVDGSPVPVILFVGRFMSFKRVQLLIEAHHALQVSGAARSVLVVVGGYPGEWEGEHPYDTIQRLGARDVFLAGWREHDDLAEMLASSDVFAAPSVDEPFGLVYLEAMAAGVPPLATSTGGPVTFINVDADRPTGWLVPPDDREAITRALTEAVVERGERRRRGRRATRFVNDHYSWEAKAGIFVDLYAEASGVAGETSSLRPSA